jgi:hypothetical protein
VHLSTLIVLVLIWTGAYNVRLKYAENKTPFVKVYIRGPILSTLFVNILYFKIVKMVSWQRTTLWANLKTKGTWFSYFPVETSNCITGEHNGCKKISFLISRAPINTAARIIHLFTVKRLNFTYLTAGCAVVSTFAEQPSGKTVMGLPRAGNPLSLALCGANKITPVQLLDPSASKHVYFKWCD